ncbi:MAG: rod shape-determining protein RodA [Candidatus Kerfeldbacteria bacterium]|nr:rod shape-determining protein RodA [Candidatus Kerfeldbacteria bacterium]
MPARLTYLARRFDWMLVAAAVLLVAVGLATLFSITLNVEQPRIDKFYRQLVSCLIGLAVMVGAAVLDWRVLRSFAWVLYGLGLALLVGLLIIGTTLRGTTGWYSFFGSTFQPVELVKIILVIGLTRFFIDRVDQQMSWRVIGWSALIAGVPAALVLLQPDFGSATILVGLWLGLLLLNRIPFRRLAVLLLSMIVVGGMSWFGLRDYQRDRILTFVNPDRDPLRSGYNIRQAIVAVGSGQLFGRGLGLGTQSQLNFLPTQDTDFIFAVLAEELGFVGVLLLLALFTVFLWRLWLGVERTRDVFGSALLAGFVMLFAIEVFLNIGGNVGLLPITGTPLPFLSFGGSALISSLLTVGICMSVLARSSAAPVR